MYNIAQTVSQDNRFVQYCSKFNVDYKTLFNLSGSWTGNDHEWRGKEGLK